MTGLQTAVCHRNGVKYWFLWLLRRSLWPFLSVHRCVGSKMLKGSSLCVSVLLFRGFIMVCALADWWYSKHRWLSAKDNTRAQGSVCLPASRHFICDGAFFQMKAAFSGCIMSLLFKGSRESPIFWMDLLPFAFDFLFALIDISPQSFCWSAAYLLFSAQKDFATFSLDAEAAVNTHVPSSRCCLSGMGEFTGIICGDAAVSQA